MELTDILDIRCVKVPLAAGEKYQAITELIDLLEAAGLICDYQVVMKSVMERESVRSTGVGQGFAIPHGKCDGVKKLVMAVGRTAEPIDFESIDSRPVEIIILLVSPAEKIGPHIQTLAKISRLMTDKQSRQKIWNSKTAEQLFDNITNAG